MKRSDLTNSTKTKTCKVDSLQWILPGTHHTVDNKIDRWVDEYKISDQHIHLPLDGGRVVPIKRNKLLNYTQTFQDYPILLNAIILSITHKVSEFLCRKPHYS